MKLYLLRHGQAEWPHWKGADDDRPLTPEGIEEMARVAAALAALKVNPRLILASPLPRAARTASIAAEKLGVPVRTEKVLRPGFDRAKCEAILEAHGGEGDLMLVGHEPDFSHIIRALTGGRVKLGKAATAAVEIDGDLPAPRLLWLFPPKALIRLYA